MRIYIKLSLQTILLVCEAVSAYPNTNPCCTYYKFLGYIFDHLSEYYTPLLLLSRLRTNYL